MENKTDNLQSENKEQDQSLENSIEEPQEGTAGDDFQGNDSQPQIVSKKNEIWEWTKVILIALVLAFIIRYFLFTPTVVDGESMMPTLKNHERLIVNKIVYRIGQPERGEIIVFHAPEQRNFIKRVIGVGGDIVEMRDDTLYINGEVVPEPYLDEYKEQFADGMNLTNDFGPINVPEDHLFVLGDNRRRSKDSRSLEVGTVPLEKVVGRADLAFWPIKSFRFIKDE